MSIAAVVIRPRQPLTIGGPRTTGNRRPTEGHLPGSTLRGAFAAAWIARHGAPTRTHARRGEFEGLFEGEVIYRPAFFDQPPTPLSVLRHKKRAGSNCLTLEWDAAATTPPTRCGQCHGALEYSRGELRPPWYWKGSRFVTADTLRSDLHVALDDDELARRGELFEREVLDPSHAPPLCGHLVGPEDLLEVLREFVFISVGGSRSTQGRCDVELAPADPDPGGTAGRWVQMDGNRLVLRMASPAVFVDDLGRPTDRPTVGELVRTLGVRTRDRDEPVKLIGGVRWTVAGGWHAASRLPKAEDRAVAAGTTYAVALEDVPPAEALQRLASQGLGLRRHEGFGALTGPPRLQTGPTKAEAEVTLLLRRLDDAVSVAVRPLWPRLLTAYRVLLEHRYAGRVAPAGNLLVGYAEGAGGAPAALSQQVRALLDIDDPVVINELLGE